MTIITDEITVTTDVTAFCVIEYVSSFSNVALAVLHMGNTLFEK